MSKALRIKDFPDYYITDTGDVYSRNPYNNSTGRIKKLKPVKLTSGYMHIALGKNGKTHQILVHRLVAQTFIPNPGNKPQVNHKNGIRSDNRVENLEWVTKSENEIHKYKVLGFKGFWKNKKGKSSPKFKIVQQIKDGKIIAEFYGSCEAERETGICRTAIIQCCNGYQHNKTAGGYQWAYQNKKARKPQKKSL